jgi:TPR repeat protein
MNDSKEAEDLYERSRWHGDFWCPPQDAEHAALLLRAAELGSINAQRDLGCCYATGMKAIAQDLTLARLWYGRAAEAGHADAQYNFGCMLLYGEGGPKEPEAGMAWIRRAAEQGDDPAQHHLRDIADGFC